MFRNIPSEKVQAWKSENILKIEKKILRSPVKFLIFMSSSFFTQASTRVHYWRKSVLTDKKHGKGLVCLFMTSEGTLSAKKLDSLTHKLLLGHAIITHIYDNHVKFEVSQHFWRKEPSVQRTATISWVKRKGLWCKMHFFLP